MTEKSDKGARGLHSRKKNTIKTLDNSFSLGLHHTLSDVDADSTEDCRVLSRYSSISDLRHKGFFPIEKGLGKFSLFLNRYNVATLNLRYLHKSFTANNSSSISIHHLLTIINAHYNRYYAIFKCHIIATLIKITSYIARNRLRCYEKV